MESTPQTDFRALCAELFTHAFAAQCAAVSADLWNGDEDNGLFARARAALAQPEPVGLTDKEMIGCMYKGAASVSQLEPTWIARNTAECLAGVRAVLARWGRPTLTPIPVSERLPEATDCDADGRCWLGYESKTVDVVIFGETLKEFGPTYPAEWVFDRLPDNFEELVGSPVAWLPFYSLPLPETK